jgi:hypothetical protein
MKLEGKWYISVYDDKQTSTYPECSDVEILGTGNWVKFTSADEMLHVTSFPVSLRTKLHLGKVKNE